MKITKNNSIHLQGHCTNFPEDTYTIDILPDTTLIAIHDGDYNASTSVVLSPEDAIKLAEQILNFYKGGSK